MTRHQRLVVAAGVALALAGCTGEPGDEATAFAAATCPDAVTSVVVGEATCGFLTVPEDRADPGRTVRVFVARILPPERLHDDPMLVAGVDLAGLPNYGGVAPLAQRVGREVIVMDTRGVGHSEPSLACPEVDELRTTVLATATDDPSTRKAYLDAVAACHDRLTRDGVEVSAYNLAEMAADAEDLRVALDVDRWNVVTYGTASRIALQMLRSDPGSLRSLLLDSPEVPGTDPRATAATATRTQLDAVLASCAADRACSTAFPNARASLDAALARLAATPVTLAMDGPSGSGPIPVLYDDAMLLRTLRAMLSDGGSSGPLMVPQAIPAFLAEVDAGRLAGLAPAYGASPFLDVCTRWPVAGKAAGDVDEPPTGNVPTLVATGAFAPYAPETVLRAGLSGLTDVTFAVDPGNGHNVIVSTDCLAAARSRWVDDLALAPSALACMADRTAPFVTDLSTVVDAAARPAPSSSARPAASTPAATLLERSWLVSLTRAEMTAALAAGGFGDLSDRFFREERMPADGTRFLLRIEDGRFSGVYNDGLDEKGEWYVGWSGTVTVQGDQLSLTDPKEGTTETLRLAVTGDRLRLTPLRATPETLHGLPTLAFDHAYLAAKPFTRADCAAVTPPCT